MMDGGPMQVPRIHMGKLTKERHGEEVLNMVASEVFSDPQAKARVWSDVTEAWGKFGRSARDEDEILFWCCPKVGDRVHLSVIYGEDPSEVGLIVALGRRSVGGNVRRTMKIMRNNGSTIEIFVDERALFKASLDLAFGR